MPDPIKTSKSLNEDEVYMFSYNHDEYLFQEIHVKSMRWWKNYCIILGSVNAFK